MSAAAIAHKIVKSLFVFILLSAFLGVFVLYMYHGGKVKLSKSMENKLPDVMLYDAAYLNEMLHPPPPKKPVQKKEKKHKFGLF
jgi:hypothetical protein